ncbi:MAG: hypothetical protein ACPLRA_00190 [Candidatus Saccharicenans sp.]
MLAHRLSYICLHDSRDEAKTWSEYILIDQVSEAYPSMFNPKDSSVLEWLTF